MAYGAISVREAISSPPDTSSQFDSFVLFSLLSHRYLEDLGECDLANRALRSTAFLNYSRSDTIAQMEFQY